MAKQEINIGVQGNDGTGYSIRDSFRIVNENFTELYAAVGLGGGLRFSSLDDGTIYTANQILISSNDGSRITARNLVAGNGIAIDKTNDSQLTFSVPALKFITSTGTLPTTATTQIVGTVDISSGTLKSTTLTTGATANTGTIEGTWTVTLNSSITAANADLAEYYSSDIEYPPGTVVVFGGTSEVTASSKLNDTKLAGVVTTAPAFVMNESLTSTKVAIALVGRVPCRVVGRVSKGDMLTTSSIAGCAIKATNPTLGSVIGKALTDKTTDAIELVEVAVGKL